MASCNLILVRQSDEVNDMKILLVVSLLVFSCRVADATELTGSWRLKYTELAGQKHFVARGITITLTIRDSTWTLVSNTDASKRIGISRAIRH